MSTLLSRSPIRTWLVAMRALLLALVVTIVYTAVITLIGALLPYQAHGSLVQSGGRTVGSALLGQGFVDRGGHPLPQWFQPRPSAAGRGWDGSASGPSNLGPNNPALVKAIRARSEAAQHAGGGSAPPDAVTASASGLDPHISQANALAQAGRVAAARGIAPARVRALVEQHVQAPDLGYLGQSTVNVLQLNLAMQALSHGG